VFEYEHLVAHLPASMQAFEVQSADFRITQPCEARRCFCFALTGEIDQCRIEILLGSRPHKVCQVGC